MNYNRMSVRADGMAQKLSSYEVPEYAKTIFDSELPLVFLRSISRHSTTPVEQSYEDADKTIQARPPQWFPITVDLPCQYLALLHPPLRLKRRPPFQKGDAVLWNVELRAVCG